jgi:hypothetical protein
MTTIADLTSWAADQNASSPLAPKGASSLKLDLVEGITRELTMVRIGRIFVFGLAEDQLSWCLIRLSSVIALRFQDQSTPFASSVAWTRKAAGELISLLDLPAPATIGFREQPLKKVDVVLVGATRSIIATDSPLMPFVPLQAISYLQISSH